MIQVSLPFSSGLRIYITSSQSAVSEQYINKVFLCRDSVVCMGEESEGEIRQQIKLCGIPFKSTGEMFGFRARADARNYKSCTVIARHVLRDDRLSCWTADRS
jgi:hypothetical protein